MKKIDQIAMYIIIPIITVILLILGILKKNSENIYTSIILFIILAINIGFNKLMNIDNIRKNKIVEKLNRKTNRTLLEDLYITSTNNNAKSKINNIQSKLNKKLKDLEVYPSYNKRNIIIEYNYKDFFVSFEIAEDKITYNYMVADRYFDYSNLDNIINEFEQETTIYESINENENFEEVIKFLVHLFNKSNEQIDGFIKNAVIEENDDYYVKNLSISSKNSYIKRFIIGVILFISSILANIIFAYIGYDKHVVDSGLNTTLVFIPNLISTIALVIAIYIPSTSPNKIILTKNLRFQNIIFVLFVIYYVINIISLFIFRFNTVPSIISFTELILGSLVFLSRIISKSSMISYNSIAYEPIINRLSKKIVLEGDIVLSNQGNRFCLVMKSEKLNFIDRTYTDSLVIKFLVCVLKKKLITQGISKIFYIKSKIKNLNIIYNDKVFKVVKNNKIYSLSHTLTKENKISDIFKK